jgi:hypothetical protein
MLRHHQTSHSGNFSLSNSGNEQQCHRKAFRRNFAYWHIHHSKISVDVHQVFDAPFVHDQASYRMLGKFACSEDMNNYEATPRDALYEGEFVGRLVDRR